MDTIQIKNEIKIALFCLKLNPAEKNLNQVIHLCKEDINWLLFKEFVVQNRIYVIVYNTLKLIPENIPENVLSDLKELTIFTEKQSFFHSVLLQKLIITFLKKQISVLPFKGPALAQQVYNDVLIRPFSDLDILVKKRNALLAYRLLKNQGFIPQFELKDSQFEKYICDEDHFTFFEAKNKIYIELHWDIAGLYLSKTLTLHILAPFLETGLLNNFPISCLSPEALLVYLCVHGSKHGWEYLEQLFCVATLITSTEKFDWKKAHEISQNWRCQKMMLLGVYLAEKVFKSQIPDWIKSKIDKDNVIGTSAERVIQNLFFSDKSKNNITNRFSFFHISIRDSFSDKLRYCMRLLFRPTDKEWLYFPVPAALSFIHYGLRPLRLIEQGLTNKNA